MKTPAENAPLAQRVSLRDLPGWWAKYLVVPEGKIGIAIDAKGHARTWAKAGRHRVLSAGERLRGKGIGLQVGWVPAGPFATRIQVPYLLSGDEKFVALNAVAHVRVADPARFFHQYVAPVDTLYHLTITLSTPEARAALSEVTGQYLAADLAQGIPYADLNTALAQRLAPFLAEEGLHVIGVPVVVFWEAEKQVQIEERLIRLREQLHNLAIEGKMVSAEAQAHLEEFLRELEADLGVKVRVAHEKHKETGEEPQNLMAALQALFRGEDIRHPLLKRLLEKEEGFQPPVPRPSKWWWVPRFTFIVLVWIIAISVTRFLLGWRGARLLVDAPGELIGLWLVVLAISLEGGKALYEKYERLAEASWVLRGYTRVDDLVRQNRKAADRLVRQQSAEMLRSLAGALNQLRSRVFRQGKTDLALRLRAMEQDAERLAEDVQRPDFGRPPYVDDALRISKTSWSTMLDYDEDLLVCLDHLLKVAQRLHDMSDMALWEERLGYLENALAAFRVQFSRRSEALRPRESEKDRRMKCLGVKKINL